MNIYRSLFIYLTTFPIIYFFVSFLASYSLILIPKTYENHISFLLVVESDDNFRNLRNVILLHDVFPAGWLIQLRNDSLLANVSQRSSLKLMYSFVF